MTFEELIEGLRVRTGSLKEDVKVAAFTQDLAACGVKEGLHLRDAFDRWRVSSERKSYAPLPHQLAAIYQDLADPLHGVKPVAGDLAGKSWAVDGVADQGIATANSEDFRAWFGAFLTDIGAVGLSWSAVVEKHKQWAEKHGGTWGQVKGRDYPGYGR